MIAKTCQQMRRMVRFSCSVLTYQMEKKILQVIRGYISYFFLLVQMELVFIYGKISIIIIKIGHNGSNLLSNIFHANTYTSWPLIKSSFGNVKFLVHNFMIPSVLTIMSAHEPADWQDTALIHWYLGFNVFQWIRYLYVHLSAWCHLRNMG